MKDFLSKLPQLPAPLYLMIGGVLLLIVATFAGEYSYLSLQGKPIPDELKAWLFPALSALVAYMVSLKDQKTDEKKDGDKNDS